MRAAPKAHVSVIRHDSSPALLLRVLMAVLATLALLLVWHPLVVSAQTPPAVPPAYGMEQQPPAKPVVSAKTPSVQDTASATHRVKAGETLWSIAARHYGDGQQWRAVARRNGIALSSDTALRVGTLLVLPSRRTVASAVSARPAPIDTTTPKSVTTPAGPALPPPVNTVPLPAPRATGALASQTTGKPDETRRAPVSGDRVARVEAATPKLATAADANPRQDTAAMTPRTVLVPQVKAERLLTNGSSTVMLADEATLRAARMPRELKTVFLREVPTEAEARAATQASVHTTPMPRHGEYLAAPFPIATARWAEAGRVLRRVDSAGPTLHETLRLRLTDEVEITPPAGASLAVGDLLVSVIETGSEANGGRVGQPTGVLRVIRAAQGGAVRAVVQRQSGVIEQGQALFAVEGTAAPAGQRAQAVTGSDVETTVTWIDEGTNQPTLQSYLLLAAGESQGVKAGDEFALLSRAATGPETRVAVVRVVRSGAMGSAVVVVGQSLPDIATGMVARRIARMP